MVKASPVGVPDLAVEAGLLQRYSRIISLDEVGRGALAGPVAVGAVLCDQAMIGRPVPEGLRDSKLVSERRRPELAERTSQWVTLSAVGWATPAEIDAEGITVALGLAAARAIAAVIPDDEAGHRESVILLDGQHDYVSAIYFREVGRRIKVTAQVKADRDCASVSAASILAKVARDAHMTHLHDYFPQYDWASNKGYGSASHRASISQGGISEHHRASWSLGSAEPQLF